jgi:Ca2+-binding RTX toxin-like protein
MPRSSLVAALVALLAIPAVAPAKVSHRGWPSIDGVLWQSRVNGHHATGGTAGNDELLGGHGNDVIRGGPGDDVIWGDEIPCCQPLTQHDFLSGGPGDDWIYASHGANTIFGGPGNDHIFLYYGHGTVDCGPGFDVVWVRRLPQNRRYRLRNCEQLKLY